MKADKLSSFALAIAAIVLLVVGAISYRDYLKAKYEKEFGASAAQAQATGDPQQGHVAPQPQPNQAIQPAPGQALPPGPNAGQMPPSPIPANANPNPNPNAQSNPAAAPPSPIQAASESRLSQYQKDLTTLQQESAIYQQKLAQTKNGIPPSAVPGVPRPGIPNSPASAVAAVPGTPGVLPAAVPPAPIPEPQQLSPQAIEQEISALSEKIRKEASVAKVVEFDPQWAFLVISGGRDRGIELDMRFAVRRKSEILGWVKITEVEENRAVAQLMSGNKDSQTARKPEPGDDIIAFNLF